MESVVVALVTVSPLLLAQIVLLVQGRKQSREVASVARSVGPENGQSLHDLLERIIGFEEYQHTRNHDVMNILIGVQFVLLEAATKMGVPLADVLEAMHRKYVDRQPSGPTPPGDVL